MECGEHIPFVPKTSLKKPFCKGGLEGAERVFYVYLPISKENTDIDTVLALKCNKNKTIKISFRKFKINLRFL
jgi:hypothetical protein